MSQDIIDEYRQFLKHYKQATEKANKFVQLIVAAAAALQPDWTNAVPEHLKDQFPYEQSFLGHFFTTQGWPSATELEQVLLCYHQAVLGINNCWCRMTDEEKRFVPRNPCPR